MKRRRFLQAASVGGAVGLAGCAGWVFDSAKTPSKTVSDPAGMEWRVETGARGWHTLAASDDTFFVEGSAIYALDSESGEELWRASGEGISEVRNGTAYVTDIGRVIALDGQSGDEHWTYELRDTVIPSTVEVTEEAVYVTGNALHAIDRTTGEKLWTFELNGEAQDLGRPAASNKAVCVTDANGFTFGLDSASGEELWNRTGSLNQLVASTSAVYGAEDRTLRKLDAQTGETQWTYEADSPPQLADSISNIQADTVSEHQLYVSTRDATVYRLSTEDGKARGLTFLDSQLTAPTTYDEGALIGSPLRLYGLRRNGGNYQVEFKPRGEPHSGQVSAGRVARGIVCVNFYNWTYGLDLSSY